jgi:hypothetical protein
VSPNPNWKRRPHFGWQPLQFDGGNAFNELIVGENFLWHVLVVRAPQHRYVAYGFNRKRADNQIAATSPNCAQVNSPHSHPDGAIPLDTMGRRDDKTALNQNALAVVALLGVDFECGTGNQLFDT